MATGYTFRKSSDGWEEQVLGRDHLWHFHPEITTMADTLLVKVTMPPKGFHDFHRHPEMNEILYILKGTAEQWVEDEMQLLQAGDSVYMDPDVVHATFNAGDTDLEFLAILAPKAGWEAGTIDEYKNEPYCNYRKD
ncbi:cupin domain-containing protein [Sediminicola luteus]|uniref:Cupin type-2 domain-containing protein n=1 Tax=Sediminicola luteus TaxID=319238 RepID=A0A2A4G5Y9_9FLAO|nr:cupin domain-containing protein [Sediminicola luteus]PCE63374.1 hypothetical protein B7P33_14240 [Sediminicola luteus]